MHRRCLPALALCFSSSLVLARNSSSTTPSDAPSGSAVIQEINFARQSPVAYAALVQQRGANFRGSVYYSGSEIGLRTQEGRRAVDEASGSRRGNDHYGRSLSLGNVPGRLIIAPSRRAAPSAMVASTAPPRVLAWPDTVFAAGPGAKTYPMGMGVRAKLSWR